VVVVFCYCCFVFFFFQAEDGIRDFHVTGVQTCALPILSNPRRWRARARCTRVRGRELLPRVRRTTRIQMHTIPVPASVACRAVESASSWRREPTDERRRAGHPLSQPGALQRADRDQPVLPARQDAEELG